MNSIIELFCSNNECKQLYSHNFNHLIRNNFICKECINKQLGEKIKNTCLKKYGQTHFLLNDKIINKRKKTNLEKYGT